MDKVKVIQGENDIRLVFNIRKDGLYESLLGATVELEMKEKKTGLTLRRECIITESSSAECMYILTYEDTSVPGSYNCELEVHYANGTILKKQNPFLLAIVPEIIEG